jgi:hypothetical protein
MTMSDLLKKIAYWALVLTLVVAEIGSFFDLFNINPWCYPVYAALLILYNKLSSYNPISENRISKNIAIVFLALAVVLIITKGLLES